MWFQYDKQGNLTKSNVVEGGQLKSLIIMVLHSWLFTFFGDYKFLF